MTRWFRVYDDLVDDPKVQRLSGEAFKEAFFAALRGAENEFSHLVKRGRDRAGQAWVNLRASIFARDDYTCSYCGARGVRLECDHIFPVARGGTDDPENLTTACRPCNQAKRDKTLEEWLQ